MVDEEGEDEEEVGESESGEFVKCQCSRKVSSMKVRVDIEQVKFFTRKFPLIGLDAVTMSNPIGSRTMGLVFYLYTEPA